MTPILGYKKQLILRFHGIILIWSSGFGLCHGQSQPRSVGFTINRFASRSPSPFQFASQSRTPFRAGAPPVNLDSGASVRTAPRAIAGPIKGKVSVTAEAADSCIDASLAPVAIPVCPVNDLSLPTPVKINEIDHHLDGYNSALRSRLREGFTYGFHLGCQDVDLDRNTAHFVGNHTSAERDPVALCEKLDEEITSRRVMGPFFKPPF